MRGLHPQTYAKWLAATWTFSIGALTILGWTGSRPARHPFLFALALSWFIAMVVAAATRNAFLKMNPARFRFAPWERGGKIYARLGLGVLRWLLRRTPLGWLNPWLSRRAHGADLNQLLREMNFAEGAHVVDAGVTLLFAAAYAVGGRPTVAVSLAVLAIPLHLYPVMLQRWNRGRLLRVMRRMEAVPAR